MRNDLEERGFEGEVEFRMERNWPDRMRVRPLSGRFWRL